MPLICDFVGEVTSFPILAIIGYEHEATPLGLLLGVRVLCWTCHTRFRMVCVNPNFMHLVSIVKATNTKCKLIVDNSKYVIQGQIKTILNVSKGYNL
jgi:hypothetical protein